MDGLQIVADGLVVSLEFALKLDDGEEIDRSEADETWDYLHGHDQIIPGLEKALNGMRLGDSKKVKVEPEDGYGDYDPDDMELLPLDAFPEDLELVEGEELVLFDEDAGEVIEAIVAEVNDDGVLLDFNHPLAGETLHFEVKVVGIRPATAEELEHGHAHEDEHHH